MDIFWEELSSGLPDARQLVHVIIRLIAATLLGAMIGIQRERVGKPAGLRTHILVTLGTCVFRARGFGLRDEFRRFVARHSGHCDRHRVYRRGFDFEIK